MYQDRRPRQGSNPWDVHNPRQHDRVVKVLDLKSNGVSPRRFKSCCCRGCAPLAEWSKALRSGRSHHSMAQVRILQGAYQRFADWSSGWVP